MSLTEFRPGAFARTGETQPDPSGHRWTFNGSSWDRPKGCRCKHPPELLSFDTRGELRAYRWSPGPRF